MYQNIPTKVLTGEVRLSYAHLSEPYANPNQPGSEPKYSVTILIPKTDVATKADIDNSMKAAYEAAVVNDWKGARPKLRSPLIYDGDGTRFDGSKFGPECAGHWVITASTKRKPQVVDMSNINCELAPQDIYSGMFARVTLNFFAFNSNGNKGVGCGLGNVMKTRDGEPLAGGTSAVSDFEGIGQTAQGADPTYGVAQGAAIGATPGSYGAPVDMGATQPQKQQQINPITGLPM